MKEPKTIQAIPFGDGMVSAKIFPIKDRGFALVFYALEEPKECGDSVTDTDKMMIVPEMFNSLLFKSEKSVDAVMEWLQHVKDKFHEEV
jgi:hypothetical protein